MTRPVSTISTVRVSFGRFGTYGGWSGGASRANIARMLKRVAAAFLWYAMIWVGYEIASSVVGFPRLIGPVVSAAVAMIVVVDPLRLFWPHSEDIADKPFRLIAPALDRTTANSR
jgi:hypothetical protein